MHFEFPSPDEIESAAAALESVAAALRGHRLQEAAAKWGEVMRMHDHSDPIPPDAPQSASDSAGPDVPARLEAAAARLRAGEIEEPLRLCHAARLAMGIKDAGARPRSGGARGHFSFPLRRMNALCQIARAGVRACQ